MPFVPFKMVKKYCDVCYDENIDEDKQDPKVIAVAMEGENFHCATCVCYMNYIQEREKEEPIVWTWIKEFWRHTDKEEDEEEDEEDEEDEEEDEEDEEE